MIGKIYYAVHQECPPDCAQRYALHEGRRLKEVVAWVRETFEPEAYKIVKVQTEEIMRSGGK